MANLQPGDDGVSVLAIALYSDRYPAAGETHGLSCIVGAIEAALEGVPHRLTVEDMVASRTEDTSLLLQRIKSDSPTILAISVGYGTFDALLTMKDSITSLLDTGALVLAGGILPTYLAELILETIDSRMIIVVGEGEMAATAIVRRWVLGDDLTHVPNTVVQTEGQLRRNVRRLAPVDSLPMPYRLHIPELVRSGAQLFCESSRGCSWAVCSFCLRGLLDIEGKPHEYRRFPASRILSDLGVLADMGAHTVTFADEDFFGGPVAHTLEFLGEWQTAYAERARLGIRFDTSATIPSIYRANDGRLERNAKEEMLAIARSLGLNKVFLGIESGSPTQIRRYRKSHTPEEAAEAAKRVLAAGVRLEIGFIMFDPLCSPSEVIENANFLLDNKLVEYVSGPTSELRVQIGSRYVRHVKSYETQTGRRLLAEEVDRNTLTYEASYADPLVEKAVSEFRTHDRDFARFVYSLKGLTRYGDGVVPGSATTTIRQLVGDYRRNCLTALSELMVDSKYDLTDGLLLAGRRLVSGYHEAFAWDAPDLHPALRRALSALHTDMTIETTERELDV